MIIESPIDINIFKQRLTETIAWCSPRIVIADPERCLRSDDLRPPSRPMCSTLKIQWPEVVAAVVNKRSELINRSHSKLAQTPASLVNGRLLICTSASESIPDGGVTQMTRNFYDEDELPPWDTWLCYLQNEVKTLEGQYYTREYLVSWVPEPFIELAGIGVEMHFMDCLHWIEQENTPFACQLKNAGFFTAP